MGWPDGAKVAVMLTVMVELWDDGHWPPHAPMAAAWPLPSGVEDRHSTSWTRYGVTTGASRLLRLLDRRALPATFGVSGLVGEERPDLVEEIQEAGHEIAAHSWTQDVIPALLTPAQEEANLVRCLDAFERWTGRRPVGWMSPRAASSAHTGGLLARHGVRWWADHADRDLPEVVPGPLVRILHSDVSDVRDPAGFHRAHQDLLSALLDEPGPTVLPITIHAHAGGRPLMAAAVDRVLADVAASPSVWVAAHRDVADHVLRVGSLA